MRLYKIDIHIESWDRKDVHEIVRANNQEEAVQSLKRSLVYSLQPIEIVRIEEVS